MYSRRFQAPTDNSTGICSTTVTSTNQQWISETCRSLTKETSLLLMAAYISFYGTPFKQRINLSHGTLGTLGSLQAAGTLAKLLLFLPPSLISFQTRFPGTFLMPKEENSF